MGRIGITYQDITKAIAELQGKQKNPTVDNIRQILGTGSKSTIARFLREWKSQHSLQSCDDGRLPSDLLGIVNGLWDTLRSKANLHADEYRQECNAKVAEMQQQLIQTRQLEVNLRQTVHTLEEQLHQQNEETKQLNAKLMNEEYEKIKIMERAASLESRCQDNHAENQRLHHLLKHMQDNQEHYQSATQQLHQEQSLFMEKKQNEYEQRVSLLTAQANAAVNEQVACLTRYDQLSKAHQSLMTEYKILNQQHMEILSQHEALKTIHNKIQHDHDMLTTQNQTQTTQLATLQNTVMNLKLNIKSRDEKIISLENTGAKANDKIETLRNENQFAMQGKASLEGQLKQLQAILSTGKAKTAS